MTSKKKFPIPESAMLDCGAILGKRGAGKSSVARYLFEHEIDQGHRCCFVDPMGDAAGLRLNPDKTPSRFGQVFIFGGPYADAPITEHDGAKVGAIVGTHNFSCMVDLSQMIQAEQLRFMTTFAGTLYEDIKIPLALFVDEAHIFAPQQTRDAPSLLLNRMARLQAQGRKRGIFLWLMTQRPARINKNVLGGTETLIAMKMTMPQDLDAMESWLEGHDPTQAKIIRSTVSKLSPGEGWVWFPGGEFLDRVQFPMHSTLDTGRTPLHGETMGGITIPKADFSALAEAFGLTGEEEEDPRDGELKLLRSQLSDIRGRLRDTDSRLSATTRREQALIDLMLDIQNRIGATIGSAEIQPLPVGATFVDYLPVLGADQVVRFHLREGDNADGVTAARRRMARVNQGKEG